MKNNKIAVLLVEPGKFPRTVHIDKRFAYNAKDCKRVYRTVYAV